jgi:hypothetical protein
VNKENGRFKKRSEIQPLNVEDRKITDQQTIAKILMSILLLLQHMLTDKVKIIL